MKIKNLKLYNFANYSEIEVNFDENITYLIGNNGSGKSTVGLTAIWFMFEGIAQKSKTALIGERFRFIGDAKATAKGEMTLYDKDIEIKVRRKLTKSGSELSFSGPEGMELNQEWLSSLFNSFLISPKLFTQIDSKKQAELLGIDVSEFDEKLKELKDEFTLINRDFRNIGELNEVKDTEGVDLVELFKEKEDIIEFNNKQNNLQKEISRAKEKVEDLENDKKDLDKDKEDLEREIKKLISEKESIDKRIIEGDKYIKLLGKAEDLKLSEEIDKKIDEADEINIKANSYKDYLEKKELKDKTQKELDSNKDEQSKLKEERTDYIKSMDLQFDNLSINEDGSLLLDNKPIKEPYFSTGELLKIIPILMASQNPELKYVFIQDFNLLDDENQSEISKHLTGKGFQLVLEMVGKEKITDKNCILLKDCKIVESYGKDKNNL